MNLLLPESGLLFWMTIIFAIVFFILARFGFPVITGMVEKRNRRITDSLEAARLAEEALAHLEEEKDRVLAETRLQQEKFMKEAAAERDRIILQAQAQAREEAGKILAETREKIQAEKDSAMRELRNEVALISMSIAEKVVRKELSSADSQKDLVSRLIDEVADMS